MLHIVARTISQTRLLFYKVLYYCLSSSIRFRLLSVAVELVSISLFNFIYCIVRIISRILYVGNTCLVRNLNLVLNSILDL
jgi:hypothetical protein